MEATVLIILFFSFLDKLLRAKKTHTYVGLHKWHIVFDLMSKDIGKNVEIKKTHATFVVRFIYNHIETLNMIKESIDITWFATSFLTLLSI